MSPGEKNKLTKSREIQHVDPHLPLMPRKGDLSSIKKYGVLRVLGNENKLSDFESNVLKEFSNNHDINIIYIYFPTLEKGQEFLINGMADILIEDNGRRQEGIETLPIQKNDNNTVSWSIRSGNAELQKSLNKQLNNHLASNDLPEVYIEDLPELKHRKLIRVVTRPDPHNYFLKKGKPVGFEYELLQRFSKEQKLWLEVVIAEDENEMLAWLEEGKADLATVVAFDHKRSGITVTPPYYPARNFIIARKDKDDLTKLMDINGKVLALFSGKYQHQGIEFLMDKGFSLSTVEPEIDESMSDFLQRVVDREYEIAMVSAKKYLSEIMFHNDLKVIATVNDQPLHRWAVNNENRELNRATSLFLRKEFHGEFYNIVYKRYFRGKEKIKNENFYISPYDEMVIKYAYEYKFDWRLVLAQMYQESKFKPDARSTVGARGLMQIMPRTAKEIGITQVTDPESGIRAGLKYMKTLRDRYSDDLSKTEKNWFALASYNAGYERIQDARRFAKKLGLDPNRWFGNVELAMKKLADPNNRKHTRFGFCNCGQTVVYVRNIKKLYTSYVQLSDPKITNSNSRLLTDSVSGLPRSPL